jgi:hypothetical protein
VVVTLFPACTPETLEPQAVETCDGLLPVGERIVEDYLAAIEDLPLAVLVGDEPMPPEMTQLNQRGAQLDERVARLECNVDGLNAEIAEATADLEATTPAGEAFLLIVRSGVVGSLPLFPAPSVRESGS